MNTRDAREMAGGEAEPDDFAAWVRPHLVAMAAVAAREVGAAFADDIVQDALVRAWQRRSTFRPDRGGARAWLVSIVLDQSRRHRLRHPRRNVVLPDSAGEIADGDLRLTVERAVAALPRRQRQVVTLFYLADLSVAEVARVLSISESAAKVHLHAARAALRNHLENQ